ncbi:isoprenoid synthase domain-containing protein, partial [Cladorrhinum sp. PSN332]
LRIPDLAPLFRRWPVALNPHYASLVQRFESKLVELVPNPKTREQMRKANLRLFASLWWPIVTLHRLETVAYYSLWVFLWDDEIDCAGLSMGEDEKHEEGAEEEVRRARAMQYIKFHLGVTMMEQKGYQNGEELVAPTKATRIVREPAEWVRDSGNKGVAERLVVELERYMEACGVEQRHLESGSLPTGEEYWKRRLGTSAVFTYCALTEYLIGVTLPDKLFETAEMKAMWTEVNRNVSIINDILSLKKEIGGSMYSSIPVMMKETGQDAQAVIEDLLVSLEESADTFDQAAGSLLGRIRDDDDWKFLLAVSRAPVMNVMNMADMMGSRLAADRYGVTKYIIIISYSAVVTKYIQEDNSLLIPL